MFRVTSGAMRRPRARTTAWVAAALAVLAVGPGGRALAQPASSALTAVVEEAMAREHIPGMAVAVLQGGRLVHARGHGLANVEHEVPVTARTVFQSGSAGKMFTAAAVLLLAEDGKLSLEDPLTRFFPEARPALEEVTVRHLLTHTSGLEDYEGDDRFDLTRDYPEAQLTRLLLGMKQHFTAGTRFSYSNTGYALLGFLVRRAGGEPYGELLARRVFGPLGMASARVISDRDLVPHRAAGYELVGGQLKNQGWVSPSLNATADGALYLSLQDWLAWEAAVRARRVLRPRSWEAMLTPATLRGGSAVPYGLGWELDDDRGVPRQHHGGHWQGFSTCYARYPREDVQVVVLANLADADACEVASALAAEQRRAPAAASPPADPPR